jgi:predicted lysophospholipase L1 biosynthesis ABC-type transport system permease subunit
VAVVNQAFVRQLMSAADPLGQTLRTNPEPGYPSTVYEIVGIIPDTQYNGFRGGTPPMAFAPDSQYPAQGGWATVMIHSSVAPATAIAAVKREMADAHPGLFIELIDFQSRIRDGFVRERLLAMLASFFGALAALLAMVGLYGMIAFAAAQRRQEIGIRLALGARRLQIVVMIIREAGWLLVVGIVVGAGLSLLAGHGVASLLFGLSPRDSPTLLAACLLLAVIAAIASFLPAQGASRLDPLTALRQE